MTDTSITAPAFVGHRHAGHMNKTALARHLGQPHRTDGKITWCDNPASDLAQWALHELESLHDDLHEATR